MAEIVLNQEQARIIAESNSNVVVRAPDGKLLGYITIAFTNDEIAEAQRRLRSKEPRYTTAEVLQRLADLEKQ